LQVILSFLFRLLRFCKEPHQYQQRQQSVFVEG
jgi:hypothetical protein